MNKQVIPINMIDRRKNSLIKNDRRDLTVSHESVINLINNNSGLDSVRLYFNECVNTYNANLYWKNCLNIIENLEENTNNESILKETQNIFLEDILPRVEYLNPVEVFTERTKLTDDFKSEVKDHCNTLMECDRVLRNNDKLSSRFNFNQIIKESDTDIADTVETLCELMDTYNIPIHHKLCIALENILYSYNKNGIDIDKENAIQAITEYFLRYNDILTDNQYTKVCSVLENNKFISEEDINKVYYLFTEQNSFHSKIDNVITNGNINSNCKKLIKQINNCKTIPAAKILIKQAFELVFAAYIVAAVVTIETVMLLLAAVFSLVVKFATAPAVIIATIKAENDKIKRDDLNEDENKRSRKVTTYVDKNLIKVKSNPVKEAANIIDDITISNGKCINESLSIRAALSKSKLINLLPSSIRQYIDLSGSTYTDKGPKGRLTKCVSILDMYKKCVKDGSLANYLKTKSYEAVTDSEKDRIYVDAAWDIVKYMQNNNPDVGIRVVFSKITDPYDNNKYILLNIDDKHSTYMIAVLAKGKGSKKNYAYIIPIWCREEFNRDIECMTRNHPDYYKEGTLLDPVTSNILGINESKDFADSEDVKDIIDRYKADQNKGIGKIKESLAHIYTKKPEKIIDETPNILEFIRNFGIFSTLAISPVITLVTFCVDKFIEMGLKRKEANRVLKYFKAEKTKVEAKYDKMKDGEKKDRLGDYIKSLDKSIEKLEDYRDNLYSDNELDRIKNLEEATSVRYFDKMSIDEYFKYYHTATYANLTRAIQLFYNELLRRFSKYGLEIEEYELYDDEKISTTFRNIGEEMLVNSFLTPDGMINIPLFKINYSAPDDTYKLYNYISETCAFVNEFIGTDYIVTDYKVNDAVYILFNYLKCLFVEDSNAIDYSATPEVREEMATILALSEAVDDIESIYPVDTTKDLFKNIDKLAGNDLDLIAYMASSSKIIDMDQFEETLKDMKETTPDPVVSTNIMGALDVIKNMPQANKSLLESTMIQIETGRMLNEIVNEAKNGNKKPTNTVKNKLNLDKAKDKATSIGNKLKDDKKKKLSMTSYLTLTMQSLKKKAMNASTKEKEISRNLDINLSMFKKSVEKALTNDKRENIIKGSIIPSFSKIIKAGILATGAYMVNPVVAAIGVIGSLACSKALTERERQMLLDEIDIELKVVEKQISIAESDGKMKDYKHLLTYQKKLQREKQRIKYHLKISGKDNIPNLDNKED